MMQLKSHVVEQFDVAPVVRVSQTNRAESLWDSSPTSQAPIFLRGSL